MKLNNKRIKSEEGLKKAILEEKKRGVPDIEIGKKFGVPYKYIEKVITQQTGINISNLNKNKKIKYLSPPNFKLEETSVWSFKQRGDWATHSGEYRGNYSPYIPRNIILRYSKPGDLVLDMFCGAGTTAIEAKLLGRRCIASDINEKAIELARNNLDFQINRLVFPDDSVQEYYEPELYVHDARDLSWLKDDSIDLICTHPPYANIIQYTNNKAADLSFLDIEEFIEEMKKVAAECFRVLRPGKQLALLIGDTRRKKHVIPLGFMLINVFLDAGFNLRELVIKRQHNCKTTGFWYEKSIKNNFLLLAHEYLPIFDKPTSLKRQRRVSEEDTAFVSTTVPLLIKKPLSSLETTTVWIYPDGQRDNYLAHNLIQRYARDGKYLKIEIRPRIEDYETKELVSQRDRYKFIWIDTSKAEGNIRVDPEVYLGLVKELADKALNLLEGGGFIAIGAKDMRFDGKLIAFAKLTVDELKNDKIWLKEIIVVSEESDKKLIEERIYANKEKQQELQISHSYILVYEKKS
ncbi:MAG: DNA methyltransferase [Candidatus Aminicenantes bacterium]|nr:DNA methyltransferase [Candidatus Aminicenantes bacterium]